MHAKFIFNSYRYFLDSIVRYEFRIQNITSGKLDSDRDTFVTLWALQMLNSQFGLNQRKKWTLKLSNILGCSRDYQQQSIDHLIL